MKLYKTDQGPVVERDGAYFPVSDEWDALINHADLPGHLARACAAGAGAPDLDARVLAPIGGQEVWAAGVTYQRSRAARIEESKDAGGGSFYDRVYDAERPELFFKCAGWRVRGPGDPVRIRRDARWSVPEPEIGLCISADARIVGFMIGNDMSSRDIEGENPLYLPQAKIYDGACALGPALLVGADSLAGTDVIALSVRRGGAPVFQGQTTFSRMKRAQRELVEWLYREMSFPNGCVLLTGTGVVPPDEFTLRPGDEIRIDVAPIGTLLNVVAHS